jgi:hypothetical protein
MWQQRAIFFSQKRPLYCTSVKGFFFPPGCDISPKTEKLKQVYWEESQANTF